jgi:uncharacterized membrane protein YebE (DUF533 family)
MRFLAGGGNSFLNASTLLTVAGVAWGLMESASPKTTVPSTGFPNAGAGNMPPPTSLPPLPDSSGKVSGSAAAVLPENVLRIIRLTISAAKADGNLSDEEARTILSHATEPGAQEVVQQEMQATHQLSEIVEGVSDERLKQDLYTLAFTIVHADEGISGAERIYLAQLGLALGLDSDTTARLERDAIKKIAEA